MRIAMNNVIAAVAGVIILTGLVGWLEIKALKADNARLEQAATLASTEARTMRRSLAGSQAALDIREKQKAALVAQTEELRRELENLYQNDKPCATWADSPVPDPVYRRLRE